MFVHLPIYHCFAAEPSQKCLVWQSSASLQGPFHISHFTEGIVIPLKHTTEKPRLGFHVYSKHCSSRCHLKKRTWKYKGMCAEATLQFGHVAHPNRNGPYNCTFITLVCRKAIARIQLEVEWNKLTHIISSHLLLCIIIQVMQCSGSFDGLATVCPLPATSTGSVHYQLTVSLAVSAHYQLTPPTTS